MLQAIQAWHTNHSDVKASQLGDALKPELLVRIGGEMRISRFMLWQSAYTELYFMPALCPDFSADLLDQALSCYAGRKRSSIGTAVPPNMPISDART